jgi:uncharacterized membrane protein
VVPTDWSLDDAMRFIISGGTSAPGDIGFRIPPLSLPGTPPVSVQTQAGATDAGSTGPPRGHRR